MHCFPVFFLHGEKDREIDRLKEMLQEAASKNMATQSTTTKKVVALTDDKADALSKYRGIGPFRGADEGSK